MTPDQFLKRCPRLWHVTFPGAWDRIADQGFWTANRLIANADLDDDERSLLLTAPRRDVADLKVEGARVAIRDQGPLFRRRDLSSILADDLPVAEWIRLLNDRIYFFTQPDSMRTMRDKYVQVIGAQEVLEISAEVLLEAAGDRLELCATNSGAVARVKGPQKSRRTFMPLADFPDRRPAEVTVLGGLDTSYIVISVGRHHADGRVETIA